MLQVEVFAPVEIKIAICQVGPAVLLGITSEHRDHFPWNKGSLRELRVDYEITSLLNHLPSSNSTLPGLHPQISSNFSCQS